MRPVCLRPAIILLLLTAQVGCGGVRLEPSIGQTVLPPASTATSDARIAVRIVAVENLTGRPEMDDLRHYLHLKTAQLLENSGRYAVLADDLLAAADLPFVRRDAAAATMELRVEITRAEEQAGPTLALAVFSSQQQKAVMHVRVLWTDLATGEVKETAGRGLNSKGAWGAVAKVNRESLLRGTGFWEFDRSLLGGAAAAALREAMN